MELANSPAFPSTTIGWLVGIFLVAGLSAIGYAVKRLFARLDKNDDALSIQSRALAVLVEDNQNGASEQLRTRDRLHKLENSSAYLKGILELHLREKLKENE